LLTVVWQALRGHEYDSRPLKSTTLPSAWRNSTSVTPLPSVPGNQAATKASLRSISRFTHSGRPLSSTVTTGTPWPLTRSSTARSSGWRRACSSVLGAPDVAGALGVRRFADHRDHRR
jgi:hypothetical protein